MKRSKRYVRIIAVVLIGLMMLANTFCPGMAAADVKLSITEQPKSVVAPDGAAATVSVAAVGTGLTYQWYRKLAKETTFTATDVTTADYSITMSREASGQHVYCVVTDVQGNTVTSGYAVLNSSLGPVITGEPESERVSPGVSIRREVDVQGYGMTYNWYSSSTFDLFYYDKYNHKDYETVVLSKNSTEYYYCNVVNSSGYICATNIITLASNEPKIISCSDVDQYVTAGDTVELFVEVEGENLSYYWTTSPVYAQYLPDRAQRESAAFSLTMLPEMHGMFIYCIITDSEDNEVISEDIYLWLPKLKITEQPQSADVVAGTEITASVSATGEELSYVWYWQHEHEDYVRLSCTEPDLTVTMNEPGEFRAYCEVTDKSGQMVKSDLARFRVYSPIYIKTDIADVNVRVDQDIMLTFVVEGCEVQYQWYCKERGSNAFVLMEDETYAHCYFDMTPAVNGRKVYCVATDKAGNTVTSSVITVTVDSELLMLGDCDICDGDGECNRCRGTGTYNKQIVADGDIKTVQVRCDSGLCTLTGKCTNCGGDGWIGSKAGYVPGDANFDKRVNLADVLMVLQHEAEWDVTPHRQTADTDANGSINVEDALLILWYLSADN